MAKSGNLQSSNFVKFSIRKSNKVPDGNLLSTLFTSGNWQQYGMDSWSNKILKEVEV